MNLYEAFLGFSSLPMEWNDILNSCYHVNRIFNKPRFLKKNIY